MYKINLEVPIDCDEIKLKKFVAEKIKTDISNVKSVTTLKKSIDARKKNNIKFVLSLGVEVENEKKVIDKELEKIQLEISSIDKIPKTQAPKGTSAVVVGSGPAGLFCALTLLSRGIKPTVIERGYKVSKRVQAVETMRKFGVLDINSNIQFGEGGAGTFSDGKLNTGTKSEHIKAVLAEFVKFGAPTDIEFDSKPHIGTDVLQDVVVNIREEIIRRGGEFLFETKVTDIIVQGGKVKGVEVCGEVCGTIETENVILAIGHSARDTFEMLNKKGVAMEQKAFSIGVRIEHKQSMINLTQYGVAKNSHLPPADYKLATRTESGRGVYTFCMCPGGEVVCGSSESRQIATNGMSKRDRAMENANSALLVSVEPKDFGCENILAGVEFQRKWERLAFLQSNSYRAPVQLLGDLRENKISKRFDSVTPSYKPTTVFGNLKECLPKYVIDGILFGAKEFDKKLRGFNSYDAVLTGVETRSSSPIRILRDEKFQSNILGLYPCGEGAGYAGGITSACVDGIKVALEI